MESIHVKGRKPLKGEVTIQGSKNAVLPILAATILTKGKCRLKNCPCISDVECMCELLLKVGCYVFREGRDLIVDTSTIKGTVLSGDAVSCMRSSIILLGPMLARCQEIRIDYPGGCVIGERPIDMHLDLIKKMGAALFVEGMQISAEAEHLTGGEISLAFPSVGATENGILCAVLAKGKTVLKGCAREPEIVHLCHFLQSAGAKIKGIGEGRLEIEGVKRLYPVEYEVPADRIVAGTYLFSTVAAGGEISLVNAPVEEMSAAVDAATQMGAEVFATGTHMTVVQKARPVAVDMIKTNVYPGFPTDLQSLLMVALACAEGESILEETIFSDRFKIAKELNRMGADIRIRDKCAYIKGREALVAGDLFAKDLRGGAALVLAGICAEGESRIHDCHYIERGYEDICGDYRKLGVTIGKTGRTAIGQS